jgi:hypothetical protein
MKKAKKDWSCGSSSRASVYKKETLSSISSIAKKELKS